MHKESSKASTCRQRPRPTQRPVLGSRRLLLLLQEGEGPDPLISSNPPLQLCLPRLDWSHRLSSLNFSPFFPEHTASATCGPDGLHFNKSALFSVRGVCTVCFDCVWIATPLSPTPVSLTHTEAKRRLRERHTKHTFYTQTPVFQNVYLLVDKSIAWVLPIKYCACDRLNSHSKRSSDIGSAKVFTPL